MTFSSQVTVSLDDTIILDGGGEKQQIEERCQQVLEVSYLTLFSSSVIWILVSGSSFCTSYNFCPCSSQLRESLENSTAMFDKEKAQERLAKLSGGVAILKVR